MFHVNLLFYFIWTSKWFAEVKWTRAYMILNVNLKLRRAWLWKFEGYWNKNLRDLLVGYLLMDIHATAWSWSSWYIVCVRECGCWGVRHSWVTWTKRCESMKSWKCNQLRSSIRARSTMMWGLSHLHEQHVCGTSLFNGDVNQWNTGGGTRAMQLHTWSRAFWHHHILVIGDIK